MGRSWENLWHRLEAVGPLPNSLMTEEQRCEADVRLMKKLTGCKFLWNSRFSCVIVLAPSQGEIKAMFVGSHPSWTQSLVWLGLHSVHWFLHLQYLDKILYWRRLDFKFDRKKNSYKSKISMYFLSCRTKKNILNVFQDPIQIDKEVHGSVIRRDQGGIS